jgi:hypothetical protein
MARAREEFVPGAAGERGEAVRDGGGGGEFAQGAAGARDGDDGVGEVEASAKRGFGSLGCPCGFDSSVSDVGGGGAPDGN